MSQRRSLPLSAAWSSQAAAREDRVPAMAFIHRAVEANRQFDVIRTHPRLDDIRRCAD